jgi:hypothetical protein
MNDEPWSTIFSSSLHWLYRQFCVVYVGPRGSLTSPLPHTHNNPHSKQSTIPFPRMIFEKNETNIKHHYFSFPILQSQNIPHFLINTNFPFFQKNYQSKSKLNFKSNNQNDRDYPKPTYDFNFWMNKNINILQNIKKFSAE